VRHALAVAVNWRRHAAGQKKAQSPTPSRRGCVRASAYGSEPQILPHPDTATALALRLYAMPSATSNVGTQTTVK